MSAIRNPPEGYHTATPWIIGRDTAGLMDWLKAAFGAVELGRMADAQGRIGHAEMRIGDSVVMMFDGPGEWPATPAFLRLYVEDADAVFAQAVAAGGTGITEVTHVAFGDRVGRVRDPYGNLYWIQQKVEVVDEAELARRWSDPEWAARMAYVQGARLLG
jgi:PhnB protein